MSRLHFDEITSPCDICELAEHFRPVSACWEDEQRKIFHIVFKEVTRPGIKQLRLQELLMCFEEGTVALYASDQYEGD